MSASTSAQPVSVPAPVYLDASFVEQMLTQGPTGLLRVEEYLLAFPQDILALSEQLPKDVLETLVQYLAVSQHPVLDFLVQQLERPEHGLQFRIVHLLALAEPDLREAWLLRALAQARRDPDVLSEILAQLEPVCTSASWPQLAEIAAEAHLALPLRTMAFNLLLMEPAEAARLLQAIYRQERDDELLQGFFNVLVSHPLAAAVPVLEAACRERELEPAARIAALAALVAVRGWDELTLPLLVALYFRVAGEPDNLRAMLSWLEEYPTVAAVPLCEAILNARYLSPEIKSQALALLGDTAGEEFYAILEDHWQESDEKIQSAAAYALGRQIGRSKSVTRQPGQALANGVTLVPDAAAAAPNFLLGDYFLFRPPVPALRQGLRRAPGEKVGLLSFWEAPSLMVPGLGTLKPPPLPASDWLLLQTRQPVYLAGAETVQILAVDLTGAWPELDLQLYCGEQLVEALAWPAGAGSVSIHDLPELDPGSYRLVHPGSGAACAFTIQAGGPLPFTPRLPQPAPLCLDIFGQPVTVSLAAAGPEWRGLSLWRDPPAAPVLKLQAAGPASCQLLPRLWLDDLRLVVLDPVSGQSQACHFISVPRGEPLALPLARAPFSVVLAGAWTHRVAWEGAALVLRPPQLRVEALFPAALAAGEPLTISLATDPPHRSVPVLIMLSEAPAGAPVTPGEALARRLLASLQAWSPWIRSGVLAETLAGLEEEMAPPPPEAAAVPAWEAPGPALAWPGQVYWQLVPVSGYREVAIPLPAGPALYRLHLLALDAAQMDWQAIDGLVAVSGK